MIYFSDKIQISVPLNFLYSFLSKHENFDKLNMSSDDMDLSFVDKEYLDHGCVEKGNIYQIRGATKDIVLLINAITINVERNKTLKYRYIFTDIEDSNNNYDEHSKEHIIKYLNRNPEEISYLFRGIGSNESELSLQCELTGKIGLIKWFKYKFLFKFGKELKDFRLTLIDIKNSIENECSQ